MKLFPGRVLSLVCHTPPGLVMLTIWYDKFAVGSILEVFRSRSMSGLDEQVGP